MEGTGIFSEYEFKNQSSGVISIYGPPGAYNTFGIIHVDGGTLDEGFYNYGIINIETLSVGIEGRDGYMKNSGTINIEDVEIGLQQNYFFDPCRFYNSGILNISDIVFTGGYGIYTEGTSSEAYSFFNTSTGSIIIDDCYGGINVNSGLHNQGSIGISNILERGIWLSGSGIYGEFENATTGTVSIAHADYGLYFHGYTPPTDNKVPFENYGFLDISSCSMGILGGDNTDEKLYNEAVFQANGDLDCTYFDLNDTIQIGDPVGRLNIDNVALDTSVIIIDLDGNGSQANANIGDTLVFSQSTSISGSLIIDPSAQFLPVEGVELTIMQCGGCTFSDSFDLVQMPDIPGPLGYNLIYTSNQVKISVERENNIWLGNTNSNWNQASNWSRGQVPNENMKVIIPDGVSFEPELTSGFLVVGIDNPNAAYECLELEIQDMARLTLDTGAKLFNKGDIEIAGTLRVKNSAVDAFQNKTDGDIQIIGQGKIVIAP